MDPALERLLTDELETICSIFQPTNAEALILGVVIDDEGHVHFQYRATTLDNEDNNANFAIGLASAVAVVLGGHVGKR